MNRAEVTAMLAWAAGHDARLTPDEVKILAWYEVLNPRITASWARGFLVDRYSQPWDAMLTAAEVNQAWAIAGKPEWCGKCDERTRLGELDDGRPYRCTACHPLMVRA